MKRLVCIAFCFLPFMVSSQNSHVFDYYTMYEYAKTLQDKASSYELTFSNSKDPKYHLFMVKTADKDTHTFLIDNHRHISYTLDNIALADIGKKEFTVMHSQPFNIKIETKNVFEVVKDGDTTRIFRYKNAFRKKLLDECTMVTVPNDITDLQRYNFGPLRNFMLINRFKFDDTGLILYSHFRKKDKKQHIRKLTEIKKTNITITLPSLGDTK